MSLSINATKLARAYLAAGIVVGEAGEARSDLREPGAFLMAHAAELLLKASLYLCGITPKQLRNRPFKHNIDRLAVKSTA